MLSHDYTERVETMKKPEKTNAMRMLDKAALRYETLTYESNGEALDAVTVAGLLGVDPHGVYKTLVLQGSDQGNYVCVIPGPKDLDLKRAAACFNVKSLRMLHVDELKPVTGYVRGGCSPIGMKKHYPTLVDSACDALPYFFVSGGQIGLQIRITPKDLLALVAARTAALIREAQEE